MLKTTVAITRYQKPGESVRKAVEQAGRLGKLSRTSRVFVKPNIVLWNDLQPFPKWGMITTSRVVEDMVALLKDQGIHDIAIGEGPVLLAPRDKDVVLRAFQALGYESLKKRYGVKLVNIHRSSFQTMDLGDGIKIEFSSAVRRPDTSMKTLATRCPSVLLSAHVRSPLAFQFSVTGNRRAGHLRLFRTQLSQGVSHSHNRAHGHELD